MNYDNFKLSLGNVTTNLMTLSISMQLESNWKVTSEDLLIEISYDEISHDWLREVLELTSLVAYITLCIILMGTKCNLYRNRFL